MEREGTKTLLMLVVVAVILITLAFTVRSILVWQNDSQYQSQLTGGVGETGNQPSQPEAPNIKSSQPTPSSCTPTQNCGSPTCGAARGTGSCGCGG